MSRTLNVVFDGEVFRPEGPVELTPNTKCVIEIVSETAPGAKDDAVWKFLEKYTGCLEGPGDWAAEHDHYLYGTPKRNQDGRDET